MEKMYNFAQKKGSLVGFEPLRKKRKNEGEEMSLFIMDNQLQWRPTLIACQFGMLER